MRGRVRDHDQRGGTDRATGAGEPRAWAGQRDPQDGVGLFRGGGARPQGEVTEVPTAVLVEYIDRHRDRFGVEPICAVLAAAGTKIAPSTYYAAKSRPPSARVVRDAELVPVIRRLYKDNLEVCPAVTTGWRGSRSGLLDPRWAGRLNRSPVPVLVS
jgi:hypothetical protein